MVVVHLVHPLQLLGIPILVVEGGIKEINPLLSAFQLCSRKTGLFEFQSNKFPFVEGVDGKIVCQYFLFLNAHIGTS
jgi:hypothetical protein